MGMSPATPAHSAKRLTKLSAVSSRVAPSAIASSFDVLVYDVFCAIADPFSSFSGWSRPGRQLILLPISPVNTEKAYHAGYKVPSAPPRARPAKKSLFLPSPTRSHRSQRGLLEVTDAAKQGWPKRLGSAPGLGGANLYEIADRERHRF